MIDSKRKRLETKGWEIGSTREFLDLSDQEEAYIELRLKGQSAKMGLLPDEALKLIESIQRGFVGEAG